MEPLYGALDGEKVPTMNKEIINRFNSYLDSLSLAIAALKKGLRPRLMGLVIRSKNRQKTQVYHCAKLEFSDDFYYESPSYCMGYHKDSQKLKKTKILKIKKKIKIPRVTNEGWNSQKQLSRPVEKKKG